jgi:hypothetical protein
MRRIDVAALYVQELERQKHVKVGKFLARQISGIASQSIWMPNSKGSAFRT